MVASETCSELQAPSESLLREVVPHLLANTRERNTAVRAAAEKAIVDLIQGQEGLQVCCASIEQAVRRLGRRLEAFTSL